MPEPARVAVKSAPKPEGPSRFSPLDFLASVTLAIGAVMAARVATRVLGLPVGLLVFLIGAGLAYYYFRGAWASIRQGRARARKDS